MSDEYEVLHDCAGRWRKGQRFAGDQVEKKVLERWTRDKVVKPAEPVKTDGGPEKDTIELTTVLHPASAGTPEPPKAGETEPAAEKVA